MPPGFALSYWALLGSSFPCNSVERRYFIRWHILEELGGWEAHNVTEDADFGIRLTRFGCHTELLPTVTLEEANRRFWSWIRQRNRWFKVYAVTWTVHMRVPKNLLRDLSLWQFFGVQLLFAGTLSQFFFGFRALDFLAGLSRSAPSIDGPHAKLVLAHIREDLFNDRGHHHRHAGLQPGQAPPFSQMGAQPAFLLPTGIYGHL